MKNSIFKATLFSLALLFSFIHAKAQVSIEAGVGAGVTFSGIAVNDELDTLLTKSLVSPSFHAVAEFGFFEKVFVQTELTFIQKGYRIEYDEILPGLGSLLADTKDQYNYIEIPVLLKFDFNDDPDIDLQLYLGPTFGFLQKRTIEGTNFFGEETIGTTETILESDIGGVIGGTARGKAGPGKFYIDLRLGTGFSNFLENSGLEISNQWTNISLGYMFPLIGG